MLRLFAFMAEITWEVGPTTKAGSTYRVTVVPKLDGVLAYGSNGLPTDFEFTSLKIDNVFYTGQTGSHYLEIFLLAGYPTLVLGTKLGNSNSASGTNVRFVWTATQSNLDLINSHIAAGTFYGIYVRQDSAGTLTPGLYAGVTNGLTWEPTSFAVDAPFSHDAEPILLSAEMLGGEFASANTLPAAPATSSAEMPEPVVKAQTITTVYVTSPRVVKVAGSSTNLNSGVEQTGTQITLSNSLDKMYIKVPDVDPGKYEPVGPMKVDLRTSITHYNTKWWAVNFDASGDIADRFELPTSGAWVYAHEVPAGYDWIELRFASGYSGTVLNPLLESSIDENGRGAFSATVALLDFIEYEAAPAEATAELPDPEVTVYAHTTVTADVATGSATMPGGLPPHAYAKGQVMTAAAHMGAAWFKSNRKVTVEAFAATAEAVTIAEVYAGKEAILTAPVAHARGIARDPDLVNGQAINNDIHDPYWQRTTGRATEGYTPPRTIVHDWLRFNERSGGKVRQYSMQTGLPGADVTISGAYEQGVAGVFNRNALKVIDAGVVLRTAPVYNTPDIRPDGWSMEFTIRVEPGHRGRMDIVNGRERNGYSGIDRFLHASVRDGHIYVKGVFGGTSIQAIDDGKWHHIAVTVEPRQNDRAFDGRDLQIYIDGRLDRQLAREENTALNNYDAGRAARPTDLFGQDTGYPFKGEIMDFTWRSKYMFSHEIMELYLDMFGYKPARATTSTGMGWATDDNRVVSNMKRMLVLTWNEPDLRRANVDGYERSINAPRWVVPTSGIPQVGEHNISPMLGYGYDEEMDIGQYQLNYQHVHRADLHTLPGRAEGAFIDKVTGKPRYVNLQEDVDLDDYEIIAFQAYPNPTYADQDERLKYEAFFASVNQALADGHKIWVTDAYLAADLGWVSRVEEVPVFGFDDNGVIKRRSGNDLRGYQVAPHIGNDGEPLDLPDDGSMWVPEYGYPSGIQHGKVNLWRNDLHRNNMYRVVNEVPGLTDLPSHEMVELFMRENRVLFGVDEERWQYGYALANRTGEVWESETLTDDGVPMRWRESTARGVKAGDQFYDWSWFWAGHNYWRYLFSANSSWAEDAKTLRVERTWAVPAGHLKVGTPVTTFGTHQYNDYGDRVPNPYRNHIRNAVIRPGDVLPDGQKVKGYAYMEFAEHPVFEELAGLGIPLQERAPAGVDMEFNDSDYIPETEYSDTWDYLTRGRVKYGGGGTIYYEEKAKIIFRFNPKTGVTKADIVVSPAFSLPLAQTKTELFHVSYVPHLTWTARGISWLTLVETEDAEYAATAADVADGEGRMLDATVDTEFDNDIAVGAAQATGVLLAPAEAQVKSVNVMTFAATAHGHMTGLQGGYAAQAAQAWAEMPQNVNRPLDVSEVLFFGLTFSEEVINLRMEEN